MAKEENKATSTPKETTPVAAKPAKKTNTTLVVVILLIVFLGLPALGVGVFWWFVGRKVDDVVENIEEGEASFNIGGEEVSVNSNENQSWPDDLPSIVPTYTDGDIISSGRIGSIWTIVIEDTNKAKVLAYRTGLVSAGWTSDAPVDVADMVSFAAEKDDYTLSLTMTTDEDNKTSLLFTVTQQ